MTDAFCMLAEEMARSALPPEPAPRPVNVWPITAVVPMDDGGALIETSEAIGGPFPVPAAFVEANAPEVGDLYVTDRDGVAACLTQAEFDQAWPG